MNSQLSPNAIWKKLGATIERYNKPKKHRVITLKSGVSFCAIGNKHKSETALGLQFLTRG